MDQITKNIKFCAYLKLKGHSPIEVMIQSRGKAAYVYKMEQADWAKLQVEFNQSDFLVYAQNLEAIKDLAY